MLALNGKAVIYPPLESPPIPRFDEEAITSRKGICLVVVSEAWCPFCVAAIELIAKFQEEGDGDCSFMLAERMEGHALRSTSTAFGDQSPPLPVPHFCLVVNGERVDLMSSSFRSENGALVGLEVARNIEAVDERIQEVVEGRGVGGDGVLRL